MKERDYEEITTFLKNNTPMIFDMDRKDIIYDENSMYFKTYKYIYKLREEIDKLRGKK